MFHCYFTLHVLRLTKLLNHRTTTTSFSCKDSQLTSSCIAKLMSAYTHIVFEYWYFTVIDQFWWVKKCWHGRQSSYKQKVSWNMCKITMKQQTTPLSHCAFKGYLHQFNTLKCVNRFWSSTAYVKSILWLQRNLYVT